MIDNFMYNYKLTRCDDLFPSQKGATYVNVALGHSSQIDYIVTSCPRDVNNFLVLDPHVNFSDHLPLFVTVTVSLDIGRTKMIHPIETIKHHQKQLRWDKADLSAYYNQTAANLAHILPELDKILSGIDKREYKIGECAHHVDAIYDEIVLALSSSAKLFVPEHNKNFFKFWWSEDLKLLKEAAVNSDRIWKAAGKPRNGSLYQKRQSTRLQYRKRLREEQKAETVTYTNELHDALLKKDSNAFWKCWRSKFESHSKCVEVEGCVDPTVVVNKFADHFSQSYTYNDEDRFKSLKDEYNCLRMNYYGVPCSIYDLNFDVDLISHVILDLKRGKAADIYSLTAEHLLYSHPILSLILTKLFRLIVLCRYIPTGFKHSYIVPIPKLRDSRMKAVTCDDFRGIAISPILSKIFEYCLLDRLKYVFSSADNQFGFKKGIGCTHAIFTVRKIVDQLVSSGNTVNLCAIDLSKAYDKVNHFGLFTKLMKRNIPELILQLIENLISDCYACVKWNDCWSVEFAINFGVRQGSVLSPFLFAIYLDNIYSLCNPRSKLFIIAYADDILLITQSVVELQRLFHMCELELDWLDMRINTKKSCCLRVGPRFDFPCAAITTSGGNSLPWVSETRYLGTYITAGRGFRCSVTHAKRSFHRAINAVFGKVGRLASEEVTLQLAKSKCLPVLIYGLECLSLRKADVKSLDFAVVRFLMKLFNSANTDVINECRWYFKFELPSEVLAKKRAKFERKFADHKSLHRYFGICVI